MNQVLHILRKDCRKLWPEMLLVAVLSGAFVAVYPYQWRSPEDVPGGFLDLHHLQLLANFVMGVLPFAWYLLITRVVQEDNLVGNRQFWVTRPYRWPLLLTEKLLLLLITICVPFFAAQAALLSEAGFAPSHYVAGILYNLACITLIILAIFALAAVVQTLFRSFAVLLALTAMIVAVAFVSSSYDEPSLYVPYTDRLSFVLALVFCAAVILTQYSTRKLWMSRGLLIAGLVTFVVIAASPLEAMIFAHTYRDSVAGPLFQVSYGTAKSKSLSAFPGDGKHVSVAVPITIANIPSGFEISPDDVRVRITPVDGAQQLVSSWQASYNHNYTSDFPYDTVSAQLSKKSYESLAGRMVRVDVDLAITQLEQGLARRYRIPDSGEFSIDDVGICALQPASGFSDSALTCRQPIRQALHSRVIASGSFEPCGSSSTQSLDDGYTSSWTGELTRDAADFGLTPVWTTSIQLHGTSTNYGRERNDPVLHICPGSQVIITPYHVSKRFLYTLDIPHIKLPDAADRFTLNSMLVPGP